MGIIGVGILHLAVFIRVPPNGGQHHFAAVLLEQRERVEIIVIIPIVEGQHDGLFRKRLIFFHIIEQILHDNGGVPLFLEVLQILFKRFGRYHVGACSPGVLEQP